MVRDRQYRYTTTRKYRELQPEWESALLSRCYTTTRKYRELQRPRLPTRQEKVIPLRENTGNYNSLCGGRVSTPVIPLRENTGNYNDSTGGVNNTHVIPLRENTGNYNLVCVCALLVKLYHYEKIQGTAVNYYLYIYDLMKNILYHYKQYTLPTIIFSLVYYKISLNTRLFMFNIRELTPLEKFFKKGLADGEKYGIVVYILNIVSN